MSSGVFAANQALVAVALKYDQVKKAAPDGAGQGLRLSAAADQQDRRREWHSDRGKCTVDGTTLTPLDQGTSAADLGTTQALRKALVANKNLSLNGQNVKIITQDGVVTLRGPVALEAERPLIVALAKQSAGLDRVHDQLDIVAH